jgi:hypothetical protein
MVGRGARAACAEVSTGSVCDLESQVGSKGIHGRLLPLSDKCGTYHNSSQEQRDQKIYLYFLLVLCKLMIREKSDVVCEKILWAMRMQGTCMTCTL